MIKQFYILGTQCKIYRYDVKFIVDQCSNSVHVVPIIIFIRSPGLKIAHNAIKTYFKKITIGSRNYHPLTTLEESCCAKSHASCFEDRTSCQVKALTNKISKKNSKQIYVIYNLQVLTKKIYIQKTNTQKSNNNKKKTTLRTSHELNIEKKYKAS